MSWERITAELMELIIGRDEVKAAEASVGLCRNDKVARWNFVRWDAFQEQFRHLWPAESRNGLSRLESLRSKLEQGEILVDNKESGSGGQQANGSVGSATVLVPLLYQSQLQGVLQGYSKNGPLGPDYLQRMEPLIGLLSRAWFLVGLLEEKERQAYVDRLTKLYNVEYLVHFLEGELARCKRFKRPMAIAFLDVDWFKNVNDRHGHLMGSHVLRELGGLLRGSVRESDVAVRYGGDEFVLVLTETGRRGALKMADRLRRRIEEFDFGRKMEKTIRITASIGVAVYPQHGSDASDLIHRADLAMYVAKHQARKNSVELAVE